MKQILQSFKTGETRLEEVPAPIVKPGQVLIQTTRSLVSLGTERMLVEFGKASLIEKARQQPDKVKMVLDKIKSEGLLPTLETVFNKLEQPLPLGYCNVGKIIEIGKGVIGLKVGDRVASNGPHAEFVSVPQNLVAKIPDNVTDDEATFTIIGSIGLQGIRLVNPTFGETIVVVGLGLIGLLTAEMLLANGCRVIGYDLDERKVKIAKEKGIIAFTPNSGDDPINFVLSETGNVGADGVIITASAKNDSIISEAAKMSRKRGRIVLVGVIGLTISRADFYEKELTFQVSCSYGPGRYDDNYESGNDYPLPFIRWTEKRNFETILQSISTKKLDVRSLITEIIDLNNYQEIYSNLGKTSSIASVLKYDKNSSPETNIRVTERKTIVSKGIVGIIGAGNYTKMVVLPALKKSQAQIKYIVSAQGVNGTSLAKKHKIEYSTTDYKEVLNDNEVDLVIITTRHNLHANMVIEALEKNKNVFVEKPLALNDEELTKIQFAYEKSKGSLVVGFNRRFSPHVQKVKSVIGNSQVNIIATMNAGYIPSNVWVHNMEIGGGRIIGEACHFFDLLIYLSGSMIQSVCMNAFGQNPEVNTDNASILVRMENGSNAVINYFSNGSKAYSKERIEIYSQERTVIIDNFRKTKAYGVKGFSKLNTKLNKGHVSQFIKLIENIKSGGDTIISFDEIINASKASLKAIESLKNNSWIDIK